MTSARPTGHQYHETILGISFKCNQPGLHQKSWRKANCENSRMFFFLNISYPCENSDWQGGGKYCDDFVSTKMFTMRKMSHRKCCNEQAVPVWAWTHLRGGQCGQWCHTGERRAPPTPHCHHSLTCPTTPHGTPLCDQPLLHYRAQAIMRSSLLLTRLLQLNVGIQLGEKRQPLTTQHPQLKECRTSMH